MVMHARKTQRMNDGYFEKHQAHPYQSSKYSSSKSYGSSSERYERIRDSPNGTYRSDSPDSQSPRDRERAYQSKNSYLQKIREKERENRDYKSSRDKYSECVRSPKDKRIRESEHRSNNEEKSILHPIKMTQNTSRDRKLMHNNCVDKRGDERERISRVGDWTEHVSSSGKKYYYNCKTEVSQWEKPREWIEREKDRFRNRERDRDRDSDRCYSGGGGGSSSRSSNIRHDKHSNSRATNSSSSSTSSSKEIRENATTSISRHWNRDEDTTTKESTRSSSTRKQQHQQHVEDNIHSTQDMDISPGDSTPTSEISYTNNTNTSMEHQQQQTPIGPVLLATALPRLISHPMYGGRTNDTSPQQNTSSMMSGSANTPGPPGLPRIQSQSSINNPLDNDKSLQQRPIVVSSSCTTNLTTQGENSAVHIITSLSVDTNNHTGNIVEGPPTPTHSETPDCIKVVAAPVTSPPGTNVSSLQGVSSSLQALRPQGPTITPSLVNYYRDDLVNHVRGWPADILEKQAQKLEEERHIMGSIQCCKVSAELKSTRSLVRLTEIQATLQEQRILFLRQQIKELEELKSQNSFMSEDP